MTAVLIIVAVVALLIIGGGALARSVGWWLQRRRQHRVRDEQLLAQIRIDSLTRQVLMELRRQQRQSLDEACQVQRF